MGESRESDDALLLRPVVQVWKERGRRSSSSLFPLPFRLLQPLRHLLVIRGVARPALCRPVPAVVPDGHVDGRGR
jgi:hypothetical protein